MQKRQGYKYMRRKAGFTLIETLLVVGILIALLALSFFAVNRYLVGLRLKEMDAKAEIIYVAAQNRLAALRANGCASYYGTDRAGVSALNRVPPDADRNVVKYSTLYSVSSEARNESWYEVSAAREILPQGSVDLDVWSQHWIIEYEPISGDVYAVFYSEESLDYEAADLDMLRSKEQRRSIGGYVGYYGGDVTTDAEIMRLRPQIQVENGEELKVIFSCEAPGLDVELAFSVIVEDGKGHKWAFTHAQLDPQPEGNNNYVATVILDSLKPGMRFSEQCPDKNFVLGTDIKITLEVSSPNSRLIDRAHVLEYTNSLFALNDAAADDLAIIEYGRHLQNLDAASGVSETITGAMQKKDISFADKGSDKFDWYTVYNDRDFQPINNENLIYYNGKYTSDSQKLQTSIYGLRTDRSYEASGLFHTLRNGARMENISLVGANVEGQLDTGVLVGRVTGEVILSNCWVYLDKAKGDLAQKDKVWVSGKNAGGLVGYASADAIVYFYNCLAATVLEGQECAGGLIGKNDGFASIASSYADCYVSAPMAAGLVVGDGSVEDSYSAGFLRNADVAYGLVAGYRTLQDSYSACYYENCTTIYTTAEKLCEKNVHLTPVISDVFYLNVTGGDVRDLSDAIGTPQGLTYPELCKRETYAKLLGDTDAEGNITSEFTWNTAATYAYNLQPGMGLTSYDFPKLSALPHYGDWKAEFKSGELVYYEYYGSQAYGFFGANISAGMRQSGYVLGDGYGVVVSQKDYETANAVKVKLNGGQEITLTDAIAIDGYYVFPLPKEMMNAQASSSYYQKLEILKSDISQGKTYYFNSQFAMTQVESDTLPSVPRTISIRSARQLYLLSRDYEIYQSGSCFTADTIFLQEMDISYKASARQGIPGYDWENYYVPLDAQEDPSIQEPIGKDSSCPFSSQYDGQGRYIYNLSIRSTQLNIGLFGYVSSQGQLRNIVMVADYNSDKGEGGQVNYDGGVDDPEDVVRMGALAGTNYGLISNCAVAGYTTDLDMYTGSTVYLGGLVGSNYGSIDRCSAVSCRVDMNVNDSTAYVGGFGGSNQGFINGSYAIGAYRVQASQDSYTMVAGFVGKNDLGTIYTSYCGTSLVGAGSAETNAFTPAGGIIDENCFYLGNGAYYLANTLHAFDSSVQDTEGHSVTGTQLEAGDNVLLSMGYQGAQHALFHPNTNQEGGYPYPAIVTDRNGAPVHYGEWPVEVLMGGIGVFYWEEEVGGSNDGIHFSYLGVDPNRLAQGLDEEMDAFGSWIHGSNLCISHEDGGTIRSFGYGYFVMDGMLNTQKVPAVVNCDLTGSENQAVSAALKEQMPEYTFHAFDTVRIRQDGDKKVVEVEPGKGGLAPEAGQANRNVRIVCDGVSFDFVISPFFADSMSYTGWISSTGSGNKSNLAPGTERNAYQIRSPQQLQLVNWNWHTQNATSAIGYDNYRNDSLRYDADVIAMVKSFTYLRYMRYEDKTSSADTHEGYNFYWKQSHDLDFDHTPDDQREAGAAYEYFTPIGSLYDKTGGNSNVAQATMTYFAGVYDGYDYTIKNMEVKTNACCAGLFGVTMEAKLLNIALHSDKPNGNKIQITGGDMWYCLGGLVGYAGAGSTKDENGKNIKNPDSIIENCTVAGYRLEDRRSVHGGWGGANIGGLVGATNMDISNCSAVNNIGLYLTYNNEGWKNVRVGGLIGCARSRIFNCYAGGKIESFVQNSAKGQGVGQSVNIWVGGIMGGIVLRSQGNFTELVGEVNNIPEIHNCYSYVELPKAGEHQVKYVMSIAGIGELVQNFEDYFYYDNQVSVLIPMVTKIYNSYVLKDLAQNAQDADFTRTEWYDVAIQTYEGPAAGNVTAGDQRNTYLYNHYSPFLTYDQMAGLADIGTDTEAKRFLEILNDYVSAYNGTQTDETKKLDPYAPVTSTENGSAVPGKYTFPGPDPELEGRDYPFPAILTQVDRFSIADTNPDKIVHVHYGPWPKVGMFWERYKVEMDVIVGDRQEVAISVYPAGSVAMPNPETDFEYFLQPDGKAIFAQDAAANVVAVREEKGQFIVTLEPKKEGMVYIQPKGSHTNQIQVKVTAELTVQADISPVVQYRRDQTIVTFSLYNKNGVQIQDQITWTYTDPVNGSVAGLQTFKDRPDQAKITGFAPGSTVFRATGTFMGYDGTILVPIQTLDGGILGLSDAVQYNEAPLGQSGTGTDRTYTNGPAMPGEALFLYGNCSLEDIELSGVLVDGKTVDSAKVTLTAPYTDEKGYTYRGLVINEAYADAVDVQVKIRRFGLEYTLELKKITMDGSFTVSFDAGEGSWPNGAAPAPQIVGAGTEITLPSGLTSDQGELSGWKMGDTEYLPGDKVIVDKDMTFIAQWKRTS